MRVPFDGLRTGSPGGSQNLPSRNRAISDHSCSSLTNCKGSPGSSNSMSRRQITHPVGFIVTDERIDSPLPALSSALHPVPPIRGGIWLLWPRLTSAQSPHKFPHEALSCDDTACLPVPSFWFVSRHRADRFPLSPGLGQPVAPTGMSPVGLRVTTRWPRWADLPG
jgi:hypothetical protein